MGESYDRLLMTGWHMGAVMSYTDIPVQRGELHFRYTNWESAENSHWWILWAGGIGFWIFKIDCDHQYKSWYKVFILGVFSECQKDRSNDNPLNLFRQWIKTWTSIESIFIHVFQSRVKPTISPLYHARPLPKHLFRDYSWAGRQRFVTTMKLLQLLHLLVPS